MINKFLNFDEMVTPLIIKIIYWIGIVGSVLGGLVTIISGLVSRFGSGGVAVFSGLLMIVLGPIFTRVMCELMIVQFEIHKNLVEINAKTALPVLPESPIE